MSKRKMVNNEIIQQVVDLILELVNSFRSTDKIKYEEIGRLFFWDPLDTDVEEEHNLVEQVIDLLQTSNPQISPRLIFIYLICEVVGIIVVNSNSPMTNGEFEKLANERIRNLLNYSSIRMIDIPLVGLEVDGEPVKIGEVTFFPLTKDDRHSDWWKKVINNFSGNPEWEIRTIGRASCPGDWELALNRAENAIKNSLLVLRGLGFPITSNSISQIGVINEFQSWKTRPLRLYKPEETIRIEYSSDTVTRFGPPIQIWRIFDDLLSDVDSDVIDYINQLIIQENQQRLTNMQQKFIAGLRWIGEATKPDTLPARYLKLAIGLEYLIGGKSRKEYLTKRGITATLAERAAFLLGRDQEHRLSIDKKVKKFYRLRSKIVHGESDTINGTDFVEFGSLVRQIALALCQKTSDFKDIDALQRWVFQLRHT